MGVCLLWQKDGRGIEMEESEMEGFGRNPAGPLILSTVAKGFKDSGIIRKCGYHR